MQAADRPSSAWNILAYCSIVGFALVSIFEIEHIPFQSMIQLIKCDFWLPPSLCLKKLLSLGLIEFVHRIDKHIEVGSMNYCFSYDMQEFLIIVKLQL